MAFNPIRKLLDMANLRALASLSHRGPLHDWGWFLSYKLKRSVDGKGGPIPWITYPALEFLAERVKPEMEVFEYGSGNSTMWWASRVKSVVSREHDRGWHDLMKDRVPANVELAHVDLEYGGAYSRQILQFRERFDIVVVDGRDRAACALNAPGALKPGGVILWDNTNRERYADGLNQLAQAGFRRIRFVGMAPIENAASETSILYRDGNCLGI